ncbi:N-acetylmuramoyl-L-alanine amidase [Streptomyces sp. RKND-216]|uniref:N-acetylmuramoyl-L-alanine amidase n=1 Tax=Streptomyces sp. RKND-216 TaxID=2562581 RepID=UPI00109DEE12|nr:N-acetylmuramoyl-L-alanine amidase [Streptomyces sp. RKND-216]THA27782.1 N-acetylmuramoyl-L-alanine amidase [Streptomyces sp. RKND-216]
MAGAAAAALLAPLVTAVPASTDETASRSLQGAFQRAAERYEVPRSVLLGVSYLQSRWDGHAGAASVSGGYGPMHLTDLRTALAEAGEHHHGGAEDPRGDTARPLDVAGLSQTARAGEGREAGRVPERLRTLPEAAELTGIAAERLREDPAANIAGGAALLAQAQRELGLPASEDPADWFGAVAAYSGADDATTAAVYAGDVFDVIRNGAARTTDSGQRVTLNAHEKVEPEVRQVRKLGLKKGERNPNLECPRSISCTWMPAPYEEWTNPDGSTDYGNHDKGDRPRTQDVDYIIVHDTEATWDTTLDLVQDPTYVSWHYSLRSSDGHVAQHLNLKDVGWHAGNWFVNAKSVGLEHEGFLTNPDAWYTEAMYRTSSRLVRHLARTYDIPLDRQHVLGHDNVPGTVPATIPGMHTDPGPYWDWAHYFRLLGAPFHREGSWRDADMVTILPDYDAHRPVYTRCDDSGDPCAPHGSAAVRLHTAPDPDAPLVKDIGLRPDGDPSTTGVNDTGARATTGQQYALAGRDGDWTAIWYLGQKAWFHNPADERTAVPARGWVVTPEDGEDSIPVYGRAYPEAGAYPEDVPVQAVVPHPYELKAGQEYVAGLRTKGEYYYAVEFDPSGHQVVRGEETYYQIQFGHRVAFVKASDVDVRRAR